MPSSWTQNYYHMVFGTRHRTPWISDQVHPRLYEFVGGILRSMSSQLIIGNGMPDHVHLLIRFGADASPAHIAREVKARSSRWIHDTFPDRADFAWQRGYGGFTVSHSLVAEVERYIRQQQEHHKTISWEAEFKQFLELHGVPFHPDHLFD